MTTIPLCLALLLAGAPAAPPVQHVTIATPGGGRIAADVYGRGADAVVLAHGAVFDKESWGPLARTLAARGHLVVAFDFRGHGASPAGTDPKALDQDVLAAVRYVRRRGATSVGVVGASMGGGAAARAATEANPGEIDDLLLLSPVPIPNPQAIEAGRILYVASRDEKLAAAVRQQWARAPEPKRLELLEGDAHAQNIFATPQGPRLTELIVEFFGSR